MTYAPHYANVQNAYAQQSALRLSDTTNGKCFREGVMKSHCLSYLRLHKPLHGRLTAVLFRPRLGNLGTLLLDGFSSSNELSP